MSQVDISIKWPFKWTLVGSSGSGKTNFSYQIVRNAKRIFDSPPQRMIIIYKEYQQIYAAFGDVLETKVIHEDEIDLEEITKSNQDRLLIICDDLYFSKKLDEVAEHFLVKGRHRNTSWLVLTQSIFNRPALRNISRNSTHITLFKTVRLNEPHIFFAQLRPRTSRVLQDIFAKATEKSYSYLDIDLSQTCPDKLRYKTNLFERVVTAYIVMGDTFRTMYLVSANEHSKFRNKDQSGGDGDRSGGGHNVEENVEIHDDENKALDDKEDNGGEKVKDSDNEMNLDLESGKKSFEQKSAYVHPNKKLNEQGGQQSESSKILSIDPHKLEKAKSFQAYPILDSIIERDYLSQGKKLKTKNKSKKGESLHEINRPREQFKVNKEKDNFVSDEQWIKGDKSKLSGRQAQSTRKVKHHGENSLILPRDLNFLNKKHSSQFIDSWRPLKKLTNRKMKVINSRKFHLYPNYIKT